MKERLTQRRSRIFSTVVVLFILLIPVGLLAVFLRNPPRPEEPQPLQQFGVEIVDPELREFVDSVSKNATRQ